MASRAVFEPRCKIIGKTPSILVFSVILFFSLVSFQRVYCQLPGEAQTFSDEQRRYLTSDLKVADVVTYVDVKEKTLVDSNGFAV
ncbi:MAG: hypothetical protein R2747_14310 [Pyrinomonadaceae bacterium]